MRVTFHSRASRTKRPPIASALAWSRREVGWSARLFGDGEPGVVLSYMGNPGDDQADWYGVATSLAEDGYTALTYNRRGVCPGGQHGCSAGPSSYGASWKDVVGAFRYLRERGARRVVLVGASIGAMSSLFAAASGRIEPAGLIEIGGVNHVSGYDFDRRQVGRVPGAKLFVSSEGRRLRRRRIGTRVAPVGDAAQAAGDPAGRAPRNRPAPPGGADRRALAALDSRVRGRRRGLPLSATNSARRCGVLGDPPRPAASCPGGSPHA
jgi:hypothetical protein